MHGQLHAQNKKGKAICSSKDTIPTSSDIVTTTVLTFLPTASVTQNQI